MSGLSGRAWPVVQPSGMAEGLSDVSCPLPRAAPRRSSKRICRARAASWRPSSGKRDFVDGAAVAYAKALVANWSAPVRLRLTRTRLTTPQYRVSATSVIADLERRFATNCVYRKRAGEITSTALVFSLYT